MGEKGVTPDSRSWLFTEQDQGQGPRAATPLGARLGCVPRPTPQRPPSGC